VKRFERIALRPQPRANARRLRIVECIRVANPTGRSPSDFAWSGRVWLVLILGVTCAFAGCAKVERPGDAPPSTTTPIPSVTTPSQPAPAEPAPAEPAPSEPAPSEPAPAEPAPAEPDTAATAPSQPAPGPPAKVAKLIPIDIKLPAPAFRGTPKPSKEPHVEKPLGKPRPPFLAPEGTVNLARAKQVAASDPVPGSGELDYVTDGDKEASDFGYLELRSGTEWVQVDLDQPATIYAALVWHNHAEARVYRDVIVQVSDDPDFLDAVTVFNNDYDNSSGMGIGQDMGYVETAEGKLIDCRGVQGRYVRFYSRGNHMDDKNHYTEVEVYGRPIE